MNRRALATLAVIALASPALAQPAFYLMGNVGANTYSNLWGLSYDGKVACGTHDGDIGGAFTWTRAGGRADVPRGTFYNAISADGSFVTGTKDNPSTGLREMLRQRVGGGTSEYLGVPSGFQFSDGFAITPDASAIVGYAQRSGGLQSPVRWTAAGGLQRITGPDLGNYTQAWDVSADGKTVVGNTDDFGVGLQYSFVWREGSGETLLPGGFTANGITPDARVIVGSGRVGSIFGPTRWVDGVAQNLGSVPGWGADDALSVSDDGNVVVGTLVGEHMEHDSFVWTPATGMMKSEDYFTLRGVPYPKDVLGIQITTVSGDGLSFGGTFAAPSAPQGGGGFVASIPAPSALAIVSAGCMMGTARRCRERFVVSGR